MSDAAIRRASVTLSLARLSRGGARLRDHLAQALDDHPTPRARRDGLPRLLTALVHGLPRPQREEGRRLDARLVAEGVRAIGLAHPAYPPVLASLPDPPPALFVQGSLDCLRRRCLGVTGSRRIDAWARGQGRALGHLARRCGLTLVSGWTSRSEEVAVQANLEAEGAGALVLVQPYGPELGAGQGGLGRRVLAVGGALVSAWPPGLPPLGRAHPRRSQLLAGLVEDLAVLQAGPASGALIAARRALARGAGVWVPAYATGRGPGGLLRGGEGVAELLRDGAGVYAHPLHLALPGIGGVPWRPRETRVLERHGPLAPDRLLFEGKISPRRLAQRVREGWLHWTAEGRIGPGFEPILRAMSRRLAPNEGGDPRGSASEADPRGVALS